MNWKENWNDKIGLWYSKGPGHTVTTKHLETVHAGPNAASRLLAAAETEALEEIELERVLLSLRDMQWMEHDDLRGCMRWYREEDRPYDTNAAFFTGLSLIVLRIQFYCQLDENCRKLLDEILSGLHLWFQNAVVHASYHYPNKYLGDLVCGWLLMEIMDKVDENGFVAEQMRKAAAYWLENHWGWGEHLSDGYASVCLSELSVLLMLAKKLPEDLRQAYLQLSQELLNIEDNFDGGPRVPALRSYAFQQAKTHLNYRDSIRPAGQETEQTFGNMPKLGNLLHKLGWHDVMPKRLKRQRDLLIPCFAGAIATARVENDIRLGSMSHFPIMPSAEHSSWGLSWQCFPVAFSRVESDWGFLQWETVENGVRRAQPANGGPPAHIPKALTETISPPVCGCSYALQRGAGMLILRLIRQIPASWESITDRFRLIGATTTASEFCREGWSQLLLRYPERELSVHYIPLLEGEKPELLPNALGGIDWNLSMTSDEPDFREQRIIVHLWAISLTGQIDTVPQITTLSEDLEPRTNQEKRRMIEWAWQDIRWKVAIDPLSNTPLLEL